MVDENERSAIEWEALSKVFVTQKEHGELKTEIATQYGELKGLFLKAIASQNWNRNALILIAVGVIVDTLLTLIHR